MGSDHCIGITVSSCRPFCDSQCCARQARQGKGRGLVTCGCFEALRSCLCEQELFDKEWEIRAMTVAEPRRKMQMAVDNVFDELRESKDDARESAEVGHWSSQIPLQIIPKTCV